MPIRRSVKENKRFLEEFGNPILNKNRSIKLNSSLKEQGGMRTRRKVSLTTPIKSINMLSSIRVDFYETNNSHSSSS